MTIETVSYAIVFLAEALIAWLYYESLFARRRKPFRIFAAFLIGYAILFGISRIDNIILNTSSFFLVNLFLAWFLYHCPPKTAMLHGAFLSFIMTLSEVLVALVIAALVGDFAAYSYDISAMILMAVISKQFYLFLAMMGARVFCPHKFTDEEPRRMVLFCALPVMSTGIALLVAYLSLYNPWPREAEFLIVLSLLALLITNLIFFVLYNQQQRINAEYLSLQLSLQKGEADAAYYRVLQEQYESQRVLIHDIKNHLQVIDGLAKDARSSEISDYIAKLTTTLTTARQARLCSDPILNLLLLQYAEECQAKGISFQCDVRSSCSSFLDAPGTTTLFGNLLSNAIEAAETSRDKVVELSVIRNFQQEIIVISAVNSCDTPPVPDEDGHFRTRKTTPGIHGVGLKGITRVVRSHQGMETMYYDAEKKRFHHIIQFPFPGTEGTT